MSYGYVYITTNLINNKKYIGQHKGSIKDESYKGSGVVLSKAIKKYGANNFNTDIIEWCDSIEQLNAREVYWINYYNAIADDNYYNIAKGGNISITDGLSNSLEETKTKLSIASSGQRHISKDGELLVININKGDDLQKYLNEGWTLGYPDTYANIFNLRGKKYSNWRNSLSQEEKQEYNNKISKTIKGRKWLYKDDKEVQFDLDEIEDRLQAGW